MSIFPTMADVDDVIAEGDLHPRPAPGVPSRIRVKVGRPRPLSDDARDPWFCPVWMEGLTNGSICFGGVGPVDSLMNAMDWVRSRFEEIESSGR